jgi:hypothetical protein
MVELAMLLALASTRSVSHGSGVVWAGCGTLLPDNKPTSEKFPFFRGSVFQSPDVSIRYPEA